MNKKLIFFFFGFCFLVGGGGFYLFTKFPDPPLKGYCAFCDQEVLDRQKFYEDDLVLALYTHKPVFPGHCLIIPKRHVERFEQLSDEEVTQMGRIIRKVDQAVMELFKTSSYLLLEKNGREVGQSVPHVHFHYIPRLKGEDSLLKFSVQLYVSGILPPIAAAEMEEVVEKMKETMKNK